MLRFCTPAELENTLLGKVWTISLKPEEAAGCYEQYLVSGLRYQDNEAQVRVISEHALPGKQEKPELEDVFMYYFKERSEERGIL